MTRRWRKDAGKLLRVTLVGSEVILPHMEAAEAFRLLWDRINNPRSACPDVEIGFVRDQMVQILMDERTGDADERWVLSRLALGPANQKQLGWSRRDSVPTLPIPEDPDQIAQFFEDEDRRGLEAQEATERAIRRLLDQGHIRSVDGELRL